MKKLVDDYAPEGITTYSETESEQVFKEGKCLFIRDWSGFWSSGQDEGSKVTGKIGATTLPSDQVVKILTPVSVDLIL